MDLKKIIIFGCGNTARSFLESCGDNVEVQYCISNLSSEKEFVMETTLMCDVFRPIPKNEKSDNYPIVICSMDVEHIAEQLELLGYIPFQDFIDWEIARILYSRKYIFLLYGFCHLRALKDALCCNENFKKKYEVIYISNYLSKNAYQELKLGFLAEKCSVFAYGQSVEAQGQRNNDALIRRLPKGVIKIALPVLYFNAYFPQKERPYNKMNPYAVKNEGFDYTPFSYSDTIINGWIDEGLSEKEIIYRAKNTEVIDKNYVLENIDREWKRIRFQEISSDIKIFDYLYENYKKKRLFRNEAHMENAVFYHYANQLFPLIGISGTCTPTEEPFMRCSEHIIYPSVERELKLEWNVLAEQLDLYTYSGWVKVDFAEYIRLYVSCCKSIKELKKKGLLP